MAHEEMEFATGPDDKKATRTTFQMDKVAFGRPKPDAAKKVVVKDLSNPEAQAMMMNISQNVSIAAVVLGVSGYFIAPFIKLPRLITALSLAGIGAIGAYYYSKNKKHPPSETTAPVIDNKVNKV